MTRDLSPEFIAAFEEMMTLAVRQLGGDPDEAIITICRPKDFEIQDQQED